MRNIHNKYITLGFLLFPLLLSAQPAEKTRNKSWNPDKGRYFFNKVFSWQYTDEMSEDADFRNGVSIRIYVDEKTGTFLFTPESYINSGPMIDFVIADQKGNYLVGYSLEHGDFVYERLVLENMQKLRDKPETALDNFKAFFRKTGKQKVFGENRYGWPTFTGDEYKIVFPEMDEEPTVAHIAGIPYSFLPVYMFKHLAIEAQLPFHFDYSEMIPGNHILLSEYSENNGRKTALIFESLSDTEYYIDLKK